MATMDWSTQAGAAPSSYDEFLVPAMFAPFAERLVTDAGVEPGSRVLDVACGTGAVSRVAARRAGVGGSVTGVDLGEPTLAIARSKAADEGAAPIDYVQAEAGALPLDDDVFDVGLCQQGLQFFPDRAAALAEMRRVLKTDGRLAIATWKDIERSPFIAIAEALGRHLGPEAAEMTRSPFALGDSGTLARLISDAGFGRGRRERGDDRVHVGIASGVRSASHRCRADRADLRRGARRCAELGGRGRRGTTRASRHRQGLRAHGDDIERGHGESLTATAPRARRRSASPRGHGGATARRQRHQSRGEHQQAEAEERRDCPQRGVQRAGQG
jgi:ubiquinone/menaquinone biosynthesis C-methylase UbiE